MQKYTGKKKPNCQNASQVGHWVVRFSVSSSSMHILEFSSATSMIAYNQEKHKETYYFKMQFRSIFLHIWDLAASLNKR